jgi:hypothetical protein
MLFKSSIRCFKRWIKLKNILTEQIEDNPSELNEEQIE